jgi:hypothetical protein
MEVCILVRGGGGDGEALCHITYAQFPVYRNSLRGRKEDYVTECCLSEQMDDGSLAALYVGSLTVSLLHYTHFRIGPRALLTNACARASVFHVGGILVSGES